MIFNKITLTNIGAYKDNNSIDFTIEDKKNTILIGGKNGAGKTTFLAAVRLALYGPLTYGYKTESKEYFKKVKRLFNKQALEEKTDHYQIRIDFSMVENFKRSNCSITRMWEMSNGEPKELVYVIKNNKYLSEIDKDEFLNSLKNNFPPSLLELCLFDGEEISKIISGNNISTYLRELSAIIFNLDLFSSLEQNLKAFNSKNVDHKLYKEISNQKEYIEGQIIDIRTNINLSNQQLEKLQDTFDENRQEVEELNHRFTMYGGLLQEEQENLNKKIIEIESIRKNNNEAIRDFTARELPFYLTKKLFDKALSQLHLEDQHFMSQSLQSKVKEISLEDIFKNMDLNVSGDQIDHFSSMLSDKFSPETEIDLYHLASKSEEQSANSFFKTLSKEKLTFIQNTIEHQKELLTELQMIKRQLKDNAETSEFKDILSSISELTKANQKLEFEIEQLHDSKATLQKELVPLESELEKINKKINDFVKDDTSLNHSAKLIAASEKFRKLQLKSKLKDVEYFSTKMYNNVMRKRNFVNNINISSDTFTVTIQGSNNEIIDKESLSAGEKELLILSIIWGVFQAANREVPFIFDTLLGRLDKEHKHAVVTRMIPAFGSQVIILSTDSEIDEPLHLQMHEFVSNEYTLDYNNISQSTNVIEGFFKQTTRNESYEF